MNDSTRRAIIDDLLEKRPKARGVTYTFHEEYCYERYRDITIATPSCRNYGYTDLELFELGFRSEGEVETYVLNRFYGGKTRWDLTSGQKGGVSRKMNRLWQRIGPGFRRLLSVGARGIYQVRSGSYRDSVLGNIWAEDRDTAIRLAEAMYGYLASPGRELQVAFSIVGEVTDMLALNQQLIKRIKSDMTERVQRIEKLQKEIEHREARLQALVLVEMQQLEVAASEAA